MRATGIAMSEISGSSQAEHEEQLVRGLAASPGGFSTRARRDSSPGRRS